MSENESNIVKRLANRAVDQISREIDELLAANDENVVAICERMVALKSRKSSHSIFANKSFQYYDKIARGTLHPKVALRCETRWFYDRLGTQKMAVQEQIAASANFEIARQDRSTGEIVKDRMSLARMDRKQIALVFKTDGTIATFSEQSVELREQMRKKAEAKQRRVYADVSKKKIVIGNLRASIEELRIPLEKLGYTIKEIGTV